MRPNPLENPPRIVFNAINTRSAGTQSVTRLMIDQLDQIGSSHAPTFVFFVSEDQGFAESSTLRNVRIEVSPLGVGLVGVLRRLWFELFAFPTYIKTVKPKHVVVLGNYSFRKLPARKSILVRHPYLLLLKRNEIRQLPLKRRFQEYLRSFIFGWTRRCTDHWIVQSKVMQASLARRWNIPIDRIAIIPNPVDIELIREKKVKRRRLSKGTCTLIYPSRWYEHKNHDQLLRFANKESEFLLDRGIRIIITVGDVAGSEPFLNALKDSQLSGLAILNIGEVPKTELYNWYREADAIVFPSESETFGNGLIEGACFSLPLLVADRPYAHAFDSSKLILFEPDQPSSLRRAIETLMSAYEEWVSAANQVAEIAIDAQTWVSQIEEQYSVYCKQEGRR